MHSCKLLYVLSSLSCLPKFWSDLHSSFSFCFRDDRWNFCWALTSGVLCPAPGCCGGFCRREIINFTTCFLHLKSEFVCVYIFFQVVRGCKLLHTCILCRYPRVKWVTERGNVCVCLVCACAWCQAQTGAAVVQVQVALSCWWLVNGDGNYVRLSGWDTSQMPSGHCGKVHVEVVYFSDVLLVAPRILDCVHEGKCF